MHRLITVLRLSTASAQQPLTHTKGALPHSKMMKKIEYRPADSIDTVSWEALDVQVNGELEIERLMIENADSFTEPPKSRGNSICDMLVTPTENNNKESEDQRQPLHIEPQVVGSNAAVTMANHSLSKVDACGSDTCIQLQEVETSDLAADSPRTTSTQSATVEMVTTELASSGPSQSQTGTVGTVAEDIYQYCPPGLDALLDTSQVVVHLNSLRQDVEINEKAIRRMEVINECRRILFFVEQEAVPAEDERTAFLFRVYSKEKLEAMEVHCPSTDLCMCCGVSWHCMPRCHFQVIVYAPPGVVAGFVRRARTLFVQEFEVLTPQEEVLLRLRGGPNDLEIYSPDLKDELGRLSVHGWVGIMHEVRRSFEDYGLTFPIDLDVRVKAMLVSAVFAINWLYTEEESR